MEMQEIKGLVKEEKKLLGVEESKETKAMLEEIRGLLREKRGWYGERMGDERW